MARAKKKAKKAGGPYLAAAMFCDSVVEGTDQALSAIRIIDQVNVAIPADAPPDVPSENKRLPVTVLALITFRRGDAKPKHHLRLVMHSPSGEKGKTAVEQRIELSKTPSGGGNVRINLTILVKKGGLFWLDVILNGKMITRMPLMVNITRSGNIAPGPDVKTLPLISAKPKS
jgi:hypothetical protein